MKRLCLLTLTVFALVASVFAQYTYTSIDFPGGDVTTTRGINNSGEIVGAYRVSPPRHALLVRGGKFIPLGPSTILGTHFSEAYKTNDRGDVVGLYIGDDGATHGFLLTKKGVVSTIDFPTASDTIAYDINESGTIVGSWDIVDSNGNLLAFHGFVWSNGNFSEVDFPGSASSEILGINARGDFVGDWISDLNSPVVHGFVSSRGQFTSLDAPFSGTVATLATDINAHGQIVGEYGDPANNILHGFLLDGTTFTSIDFPGAQRTTAWGINNAGQIVGNHFDTADSFFRGFLAQPGNKQKPE